MNFFEKEAFFFCANETHLSFYGCIFFLALYIIVNIIWGTWINRMCKKSSALVECPVMANSGTTKQLSLRSFCTI